MVEELIEATGNATIISKLDMAKGYYQVKVREEEIHKTAFVCHRGKFVFTRMPFGVKNAPAIFHTLMEEVLQDLGGFVRAYMDDLIIFSKSRQEHQNHIKRVLQALQTAGLTANPSKCQWGGKQLLFLGHIVGQGGVAIPEARAAAIANFEKPSTKRGLRAFLGTISYYIHTEVG